MKFTGHFFFTALGTCLALYFLPWWTMAIVAFIAGLTFAFKNSRTGFFAAFLAVLLTWLLLSVVSNIWNEGYFSAKMQPFLLNYTKPVLFVLPGILGGMIAGFAAATGNLVRNIFAEKAE